MTLRGELDAFPLETVVQLIHSTSKTGQLEVRGADGGGTLGFDGGRLVAATSGEDGGEPALGAVFAVNAGSFEFIPWNDPPAANLSGDLDQLLDRAVEERDRIVAVRRVIPDDRSRFRLSERAAEKGNITLAPDQWRTLLAVNGDRDVRGVADQLRAGTLVTRATLAGLVESGFIDVLAPAEPEPAPPEEPRSPAPAQWSPPTEAWAAPAPAAETWAPPAAETPAPAAPRWDAPAPDPEAPAAQWDMPAAPRWEPAAPSEPEAPSAPAWAAPAPFPAQDWERPAPTTPAPAWEQPAGEDLRADLAAALDARLSAIAPSATETVAAEPAPAPDQPSAADERLAALSGVFAPAPQAAPTPPIAADRIDEWTRPAEAEPEAPAEEKKKGLFGFLKRDEPAREAPSAAASSAGRPAARAGQLAAFANALLAEYNSGHYGKGRLDDRMANLLMRVDEQADPIDRPLPIVDDRIDAEALDREQMPESQVVPYLALLAAQIYEDAERTFGKDKAKKGYKAAQQQVFGADASALAQPDVAGRLPRV